MTNIAGIIAGSLAPAPEGVREATVSLAPVAIITHGPAVAYRPGTRLKDQRAGAAPAVRGSPALEEAPP